MIDFKIKGTKLPVIPFGTEFIFKLEQKLQQMNKENKYLPAITFHGKYECFSKLSDWAKVYDEYLKLK